MKLITILTVLFTHFIIKGCFGEESFIKTPEPITYAIKGSDIFLNWTYSTGNPSVSALIINWFQCDAAGNQIGRMIMTLFSGTTTYNNDNFLGRVSYEPNAGMLIKNVSILDEGYMCCGIQYDNGHAHKNTIQFVVTILPQIGLTLKNETIIMIDTVSTLSCQFDARPAPATKWYLNSKDVNSSRYSINSTTIGIFNDTTRIFTTLTINLTQPEDTGIITCAAILPNGNISSSTTHIVYYAPRGTTIETNRVGNIGELGLKTVFTCKANGNPMIFYQIYKEGTLLTNSSTGSYTINSTAIEDKGSYSCVPVNYLGEGPKSELNFTVHVLPRLQSHSGNEVQALLGSSVTLYCTFYGQPAPNITWTKIGSVVSSKANISVEIISANFSLTVLRGKLQFDSVEKLDHGDYNCLAKNSAGSKGQNLTLDVQYSPEFNRSLKQNYTLIENSVQNYSLICVAEGNPPPRVNWYVADAVPGIGYTVQSTSKNLISGTQVENVLTLVGVTRNKASRIACNASNTLGSLVSNSAIIVNYHPSTSLQISANTTVILGNAVNFSCQVNSQPTSELYWKKDSGLLNNTTHSITTTIAQSTMFSKTVRSNISISSATKLDDGLYSCTAINSVGNLTQSTYLHVKYKPEFITLLQPTSNVLEGSKSHVLECSARSSPAATVTWTKNGSVLQNTTENSMEIVHRNATVKGTTVKSTLTLKTVRKDDYGNYSCRITNEVGTSSSQQQLIVTYAPLIVASSLKTMTVNSSQSVKLSCDIQASPDTTSMLWQRNNQSVSASNRVVALSILTSSAKHSLKRIEVDISNASRFDSGIYDCKAGNDVGNVSKSITLIVNYAPLVTKSLSSENIRFEGKSFNLTCQFSSSPISSIQWTYNGTVITSATSGYNITTSVAAQFDHATITTSLMISNLRRGMHGEYKCQAENHQGIAARTTNLIVYYGPEFHSNLTGTLDIVEYGNATFECEAEGYPAISIEWQKNGETLKPGQYDIQSTTVVSITNKFVQKSILKFVRATENDTATFICYANNSAGTKQQRKQLNVLFAPKLLTKSTNVTVNETNAVSLNCATKANPAVSTHHWTLDGASLSFTGSLYYIASAKAASTGKYTCQAVNSQGSSEIVTFKLVVNLPPTFTKFSECRPNITTAKMICECGGTGVPMPSVYWTKGISPSVIGRGNTYEKSLAANDVDGTYACHLENLLQKVSSRTGFYYNAKPFTEWTLWGSCNSSCGSGYQTRRRSCNFLPCDPNTVVEYKNCTGPCTKPFTEWTVWGSCNVTCGSGFEKRKRTCNFPPCDPSTLTDYRNCTGACPPKTLKKDEAWAIALYVLIPVIVVLLVILLLWIARSKRRKEEESPIVVPVYGNLSKPPSTRSIPTKRDIYLPDANFGTMNSAYLEEEKESPRKDDVGLFFESPAVEYENMEAEINFAEEYPLDSSTDDPSKAETLSPKSSADANSDAHVLDFEGTSVDEPKDPKTGVDSIDENVGDGTVDDNQTNNEPQNDDSAPYSFYNEMVTAL